MHLVKKADILILQTDPTNLFIRIDNYNCYLIIMWSTIKRGFGTLLCQNLLS